MSRSSFPITAVIESGNFVAQLSDGNARRDAAGRLKTLLRLVCAGQAPWVLHDVAWNRAFLEQFLDGADTQSTYVQHAQDQLGAGDLCILTERAQYSVRTKIAAEIWTLDQKLRARN